MNARLAVVVLGASLAGSEPAAAETTPPAVSPGDRVRFATTSGGRQVGTIVETKADVWLIRGLEGDVVRVPAAELRRLEVHRGRRSRAREGALIGMLPGALIGAVGGGLTCWEQPDCSLVLPMAFGGLLGGAVTGGLGAGVGSLFKTDRWERVPTPRAALQVRPAAGGGVAVGMRLSF